MLKWEMGFSWLGFIARLSVVIGIVETSGLPGCDLFRGRWLYDETYPLYKDCTLEGGGFNCLKNGRPDHGYLMYKWKPLDCKLPRFEGRDFLEKMRGKKLMFVGDSLSFNQWQSLACLVHSAEPESNYTLKQRGSLSILSFPEYNVSLMELKDGFLVDMITVEKIGMVLKLDSISRGDMWLGTDVVIFNSYHWWTHRFLHFQFARYLFEQVCDLLFGSDGKTRMEYYMVGGEVVKNMSYLTAYQIAMTTWANWADANIDQSKTKVFLQGVSASHIIGDEWHEPKATCHGQTYPIEGSIYPGGLDPGEMVLKDVVSRMKHPVYLLDISLLTQLRKDGHPSIYAGVGGSYTDCSHWCLPGVPDSWNELLYAALFYVQDAASGITASTV